MTCRIYNYVIHSFSNINFLRHFTPRPSVFISQVDAHFTEFEFEAARHGRAFGDDPLGAAGRVWGAPEAEIQHRAVLQLQRRLVLQPQQ